MTFCVLLGILASWYGHRSSLSSVSSLRAIRAVPRMLLMKRRFTRQMIVEQNRDRKHGMEPSFHVNS